MVFYVALLQKIVESIIKLPITSFLSVTRMIKCKPEQRTTPSDAIQHKFLEYTNLSIPSLSDMMLLPTSTLLLDNIYPENAGADPFTMISF